MNNLRLSNNINAAHQLQELEVALAIVNGQKEEMDLIKSHFTMNVCCLSFFNSQLIVVEIVEAR